MHQNIEDQGVSRNYRFVTGPFEGSVVEEGTKVLDVPHEKLDDDLKHRVQTFAENKTSGKYPKYVKTNAGSGFAYKANPNDPISWEIIMEDYENSWESQQTDLEEDLLPISQW